MMPHISNHLATIDVTFSPRFCAGDKARAAASHSVCSLTTNRSYIEGNFPAKHQFGMSKISVSLTLE
ncbi:hypothetical protein SUGI_1053210 [Cryptomeria japonica]|nr:hypothetical protein SUGI_1053210 [Cryptomeria japonica]